jgi:hypothetical protein
LFLARGLLLEGMALDEVQAHVEKGLSLARTEDSRTLGWLLLADVYNRRGQPERSQEALMHARERAPSRKNGVSP